MRYTDVCFFSLSGVLFPREQTTPQLNETVKHDNIRESDRHDRRYMYIPSFALPIYKTTCHAKPYLCCLCCCCCCCCYCTTYCWLVLLGVFSFSSNSLAKATWWWMLYRTLRKVPGTTKVRLWEKTCESWLQDVLLLLSFLLWCSDDRQKNTRTGTPWCIADWLLQVLRSRLITTNY